MEIDVYADILFLINAGMDGLCFLLTSRLLHQKPSIGRIVLGAVVGGLYAVVALFLEAGQATTLACDVGVCLIMCGIVFARRKSSPKRFFLSTAIYFVLSMLLGGVMTALFHLLNRVGFTSYLPNGSDGPGTWLFAVLALMGSGITLWGGRFFRRSSVARNCHVTVEVDGHRIDVEGLLDTGNLLQDPLSGRAVVCVDREALSSVLPTELSQSIQNTNDDSSLSNSVLHRRIRLIPANTATGTGLLWGIIPDRVEISMDAHGQTRQITVDVVIAAAEIKSTQALVPAELMDL